MFAFVSALSVPAVSAKSNDGGRLVCTMEMDVVWATPPYWEGTIAGDITGTIVFVEQPATFPGMTEHFSELFTITTTDGVVIKGSDTGVYNLNMFKFRANGVITEVSSPDWQWLVGYGLHEMGMTTPLVIGGAVHATGTIMLMAP